MSRPVHDVDEEGRYAEWEGVRYPVVFRTGIKSKGAESYYVEDCTGKKWQQWYRDFNDVATKVGAVLIQGDRGIDSLVSIKREWGEGVNFRLLKVEHTFK